jgi:hypothetical protein
MACRASTTHAIYLAGGGTIFAIKEITGTAKEIYDIGGVGSKELDGDFLNLVCRIIIRFPVL